MKKLSTLFVIFLFAAASIQAQDDNTSKRERKGRPDVPGTFLIELGFNLLQDAPDVMDTKVSGSRTLNLYYYYDKQIGNSGFFFFPGIGAGLDRYSFDENITLQQAEDGIVSIDSSMSEELDKSLLSVNYLDIPVELRFYTNPNDRKRSFKVGLGAKFGMRFSSKTKLKFEENDENIKIKNKRGYELNRFRYGVIGRIGVGGFNVFYYQSLSDLFDGDSPAGTEDTSNITIGLSFTGF